MKGWNKTSIDKLKNLSGVKSVVEIIPAKRLEPNGRIMSKFYTHRSPQKAKLAWDLWHWCIEHNFELKTEHKFHEDRKFKFDFYIDNLKIAIEYEGGIYKTNLGHTGSKGVRRDIEKYNLAASLGIVVLRFTCENYKSLITEVNKYLSIKNQ